MDPNPGQQPQPIQPQPQPVAPPQPAPVFQPMQPQPQMAPVPVPLPPTPPKKNMLWLWITIGVIVAVIIGLVIGFFAAKAQADTAADEYTASAKTYLGDVYDATSGSANDPADIKDDIAAVDKPKLEKAFLSSASSKYGDAEDLSKDIDSKVSDLESKIATYADFYDFYKKNTAINTSVSQISSTPMTASNASSLLKQVGVKLDEFKKLVEDTTFPAEIADKKTPLVTAAKACSSAWHRMESAFDDRDQSAYLSALDDYRECVGPLKTAAKPFNDFYNELGSKLKSAGKDVQDLRDSIESSDS